MENKVVRPRRLLGRRECLPILGDDCSQFDFDLVLFCRLQSSFFDVS
jgi:hypothetical protein